MTTSTHKGMFFLLAGIYLLGCEGAVIHLASSWSSTNEGAVVAARHADPGKPVPNLSWPQRRMHLPLVGIFPQILPHVTDTIEYGSGLVWLCHMRQSSVFLSYTTFLIYASDPSPPSHA